MGTGKQRRKGNLHKKKKFHRQFKTKAYTRDADQIFDDNNNQETAKKLLNQDIQEDMPGLGQNYCIQCARYFIDKNSIEAHRKTKVHKQACKRIKEKPYTLEEAEKIQY